MLPLTSVPEALIPALEKFQSRWPEAASPEQQQVLQDWLEADSKHPDLLARALAASDYIAESALQQPGFLTDLVSGGQLFETLELSDFEASLTALIAGCADEVALDRGLRLWRRRHMLRIVWRDLCRLADTFTTTADMSFMAEAVVQQVLNYHHRLLVPVWGEPIGRDSGEPQQLLVLGMGKLGGYELNVSSDIDLIFAYPESGETVGGKRQVSNQEFFIKLGQKLIKSLDAQTFDGFVFRVDMRLRPYGDSGALVLNFDSIEDYYQTQGREWERYAMIKARVIAGPADQAAALMQLLRPFTYRRYVDFSAIQSLRDMKALINREVARTGKTSNVKLGAGGIREIEFVVQAFQLIRGGRDERLQTREVRQLLPLLEEQGYLPERRALPLLQAYCFLRDTEHAIQGYKDKQTQALPVDAIDQQRLAWVMGFASWEAFVAVLDGHRQLVNHEFQAVVADSDPEQAEVKKPLAAWHALWVDSLDQEQLAAALAQQHYAPDTAADIARQLLLLKNSRPLLAMQTEGRARLDALMPRLLKRLLEDANPAQTLQRILVLVEAVARRSAYILLLVENPDALNQLIRLCSASPWIADQLARYPALLDELLDARSLYSPPDRQGLGDELRQQMLRVEWDDLEGQMESLRYFRFAHSLRVAAAEVVGVLPLMQVSDYLTWIAEAILEHVHALAWRQMVARHGRPGVVPGQPEPEFIIVGYGKLGGIELGHGSDLDLVFIHDADANGYTDGEKSIDNQSFFTRMGQKIIHILNTPTISGQLYEVDMRLRPSGNSGLLVSSLKAFEKYQREDAWTWEHQALVRTRVVAGGERLAADFSQLRETILCLPRPVEKLRADVVSMRQRMRDNLGTKGGSSEKAAKFHLKQDAGGIVDIEFMVQYAVVAWAHNEPKLARWSDNIRILGQLEQAGLLGAQDVSQLTEAYKAYRSAGHRLALQRLPGTVTSTEFASERAHVVRIWQSLMGDQAATTD